MQFRVTLSDNKKYILCTVSGEFTAADARAFTTEIDALSRATGCKRFLTDVRNATNVSHDLDNYQFAYRDMELLSLQRDVRAATLISHGDESHDFSETVALNAGYYVRAFDDEEEAIAWLEE